MPEQRVRSRFGLTMFLISIAIAVVFLLNEIALIWYGLLVIPLFLAGLGLFQAREKT